MKRWFFILMALFSFLLSVKSQNFHFIYIRLDGSMDYSIVAQKLKSLTTDIEKNNEKFVALFSNSTPAMSAATISEVQDIINEFSITSSFMAIDVNEELKEWLNTFENNKLFKMNGDKIVLTHYSSITFEMFVGYRFFETEMQNHLLSKFLFASDLQSNNTTVNYYTSSQPQLTEDNIKFNEIYQTNNLQIQFK